MPANPFSYACSVVGCPEPVTFRMRCARHSRAADQLRGLSSDRLHRVLYSSVRWKRLRLAVLTDHYTCQCPDCAVARYPRLAEVVHHRHPHHGDVARFFDVTNLQPMAKRCHDRLTARSRRGGRVHDPIARLSSTTCACGARNFRFS